MTECIEQLKYEPDCLPEGKIHKQAKENLKNIDVILQKIHERVTGPIWQHFMYSFLKKTTFNKIKYKFETSSLWFHQNIFFCNNWFPNTCKGWIFDSQIVGTLTGYIHFRWTSCWNVFCIHWTNNTEILKSRWQFTRYFIDGTEI